ncbi:hypothetical protein L1987_87961 [Smallanthus sonchifolius]|nr:hypothetical protein L1987_87961 [Smallanthus sonchifolius]
MAQTLIKSADFLHHLDFFGFQVQVRIMSPMIVGERKAKTLTPVVELAAKKREMRYDDIKRIERAMRCHFHDDITVVVVYLDYNQGWSTSLQQ